MCQFLSTIATRDGRLLFCEEDCHETIIVRAGLSDRSLHVRHWVRLEQARGAPALTVDESSAPGWFHADEWQPRMDALLSRLGPPRAAYDAVVEPAWTAYKAVVGQARAAYKASVDPALAAYDAVVGQARAAYKAVVGPARAAYARAIASVEGYMPPRTEVTR